MTLFSRHVRHSKKFQLPRTPVVCTKYVYVWVVWHEKKYYQNKKIRKSRAGKFKIICISTFEFFCSRFSCSHKIKKPEYQNNFCHSLPWSWAHSMKKCNGFFFYNRLYVCMYLVYTLHEVISSTKNSITDYSHIYYTLSCCLLAARKTFVYVD